MVGARVLGMPLSPGTSPPQRRAGEYRRLLAGNDGLDLVLRVIPGHAGFPAHAVVDREIGLHAPGVLGEGGSVFGAGIEHLVGCLDVLLRSAQQEIGDVAAGFRAIEVEAAAGIVGVALVHLHVQEVAAEHERVGADGLGKGVADLVGIFGPELGLLLGAADVEIEQREGRHRIVRGGADDAQGADAFLEAEAGERRDAAGRGAWLLCWALRT